MAILDIFKSSENKKLKNEIDSLKLKISEYEDILTPETMEYIKIAKDISTLIQTKNTINSELSLLKKQKESLHSEILAKHKELNILNEELELSDYGLYKPTFEFATSAEYKNALTDIRTKQKNMVSSKTAVFCNNKWEISGSKSKGNTLLSNATKQILLTFNSECDLLVSKAKHNNIIPLRKKMEAYFTKLNNYNKHLGISITYEYLDSKLKELSLSYKYQLKLQNEKDEEKRIREQMKEQLREEAILAQQLKDIRQKTTKELSHYSTELSNIMDKLNSTSLDSEKELLISKQAEIKTKISDLEEKIQDADYREQHQKAGYVYVISNIGSFGENIYKIGMTRRLDPMDRINELGSASVPFNFDVHAMIFSEDAPKLEAKLHKTFELNKVNMVNTRREFFNISLDEIETVVKQNFDATVKFIKIAEASQYRETLKIKENLKANLDIA